MSAPDRCNVLILHADQHRWDCLGVAGNPDVRTPNLDALAGEAVRYDNAFCPFPVCTPSRYSLLTGLYAGQHTAWTNHSTLPSAVATFPKILRQAGYHTAAVGKMHFAPTYLDVGFDRMLLAEQDGPGRFDDDYHRYLAERGLVDWLDLVDQRAEYRRQAPERYWKSFGAMESDLPEEHHSTTWVADRAMEELAHWSQGGNLLMVGFVKPHHPFDPPAPWSRMYDPAALKPLAGWTETPPAGDVAFHGGYFPHEKLTEDALRGVMAMYYATLSQIDYHVGRMVGWLKQQGLYDNTLIIFTSDHGEYMGFHHLLLKNGLMYDPLTRVPLIIKYPKGGPGAGVSPALTNNVDLAPTILGVCGCQTPPAMMGRDLRACPQGAEMVFCENFHPVQYMARSLTHKLIWTADDRHCRFFDLRADPMELKDLYRCPQAQSQVQRYKDALLRWVSTERCAPSYLDEYAPTIAQPNVRSLATGHRAEMEAYFQRQARNRPAEGLGDAR